MKKTLISILLILALCMGLLAGCGSSDTTSSDDDTGTSETTTTSGSGADSTGETADAGEEGVVSLTEEEVEAMFPLEENVTYTIYYPYSPALLSQGYDDPAQLNFFSTLEEMTNVTLDFTTVSVEVNTETFNLTIVSGEYPDIFSQSMHEYSGGLTAAINDDIILDLKPYMEQYAPHYMALIEGNDEFRKVNYTDDGQLPQFMSYHENAYVNQGYFIRTDWLEELGLDTPVTYDDWYDVLLAFDTEYDMTTPSVGVPTSGYYGYAVNDFIIRDGEAVYVYGDDEIQSQYLAQCEKWYSAGLYNTESIIDDYYTATDLNGMISSGDLILTTTDIDQYKVFQEDLDIVAVAAPVVNEGETPYTVVNQASYGNGNTITTSCEDVETLVAYMDYWYSDVVIELANWGTLDETFVINEDGSYSYTDEVLNFSGGLNLATSVFCAGWEPTVIDWDRKDASYTDDQLAALDIWNDFDKSTDYPTQITFTEDETEVINTVYTDIQTYVDEQYARFQIGELTYENDFADFVATLESMGIQEVVDVYQAAYERYVAR